MGDIFLNGFTAENIVPDQNSWHTPYISTYLKFHGNLKVVFHFIRALFYLVNLCLPFYIKINSSDNISYICIL